VIALAPIVSSVSPDQVAFFTGTCEGAIAFTACGERGFGYDPAFIPTGHNQSFGELGEDVKNTLSHRARALNELKEWLAQRPKAAQ
jgi:XTP/dITP diphosphohydrolase